MDKEIEIRRRTIARQIQSAMEKTGISRSALAAAMGKKPSVVTEWLSGNHNFTSDLLAQISSVLKTPVTGVEMKLVDGYGDRPDAGLTLNDPAGSAFSISNIVLQPSEYRSLEEQSKSMGVSVRGYAELILAREARKHLHVETDPEVQKTSAFLATCMGAWAGEEYDSVEESLANMRTVRKVEAL